VVGRERDIVALLGADRRPASAVGRLDWPV
jgi:hypothetical protein